MLTLLHKAAVRRASVSRRFLLVLLAVCTAAFNRPAAPRAWAATATSTALTVTSGGSTVTTVASGSKVTLTATVTANGTALTTGLVNFCDATATYCTDIHILGSAQLTSAGTATLNLRPGTGNRIYKAAFAGTNTYTASTSGILPLTVTGSSSTLATTTSLSSTGSSGNYVLTATVAASALSTNPLTGTVSFLDTSNGNKLLGTGTLGSVSPRVDFSQSSSLSLANPSTGLVAGDFNGDGFADLAVIAEASSTGAATVTIFMSNGDGTFTQGATLPAPTTASAIAAVDLNGDGNLDLVVAYDTLTVYLGNGDGTFTARPAISTLGPAGYAGNGTETIKVGDLNNDGKPDLVLGGWYAEELLGNGDGSFATPIKVADYKSSFGYEENAKFSRIALADFNGDGKTDAYLYSYYGIVLLLLGNGDGTFSPANTPTFGDNQFGYATADFNGDGISDLATTDCTTTKILYGSASTPLTGATAYAGSSSYLYNCGVDKPVVADFNGDGQPDLLLDSFIGISISFSPFPTTQTYSVPYPVSSGLVGSPFPVVADFNGDGQPDVAYAGTAANVSVLLSTVHAQSVSASLSSFSLATSGNHVIQASYSGDSHYSASTSGTVTLVQSSTTSLKLTANPASGVYGQQVSLSATLSPYSSQGQSTDGELITFLRNGVSIGTAPLSSGMATLNTSALPSGTATLTASYAGDTILGSATSNSLSYTVKIAPVLSWPVPASSVYTGQPVGAAFLNATSSAPGTFTYTYTLAAQNTATLAGTSILPAGSYVLQVSFAPTDTATYLPASLKINYTVQPAPLTLNVKSLSRAYGNANPELSTTVSGALNSDTFTVTGSTTAVLSSPPGQYPISYSVSGGNLANYAVASATGTLTVTQATPTITWGTYTFIYGTALSSAQLNASAPIAGTFTYNPPAGAVLNAGSQTLTATFVPADTTDYVSSVVKTAYLLVNKAPLAISAANTARVYGAANPTFTGGVTGGVNGDTFAESFSTTATAASPVGSYAIVPSVTGAALANYAVTPTSGVLTISQAGTATTFGLSNSNTTLTATVLALTSGVPSGSVGFYVNQVLVGTGTLTNGTATYTTSSAPPANAVISAQYSGDVNFTQSASQPILLLTMQPASSSLTVSTAGSVTDAITLSSVAGFTGSLTLSCNGLPQGATCSFSPASLTFSGSSTTASSNMTIHTGGTGANIMPRFPGSLVIPGSPLERNATLLAMISFPGLFAMAFLRRKKRPVMQSLLVLLLFSGIAVSLTACGGSPASSATSGGGTKTVTGTSSVTVLATGSNGFSQSTAVTLTVQ